MYSTGIDCIIYFVFEKGVVILAVSIGFWKYKYFDFHLHGLLCFLCVWIGINVSIDDNESNTFNQLSAETMTALASIVNIFILTVTLPYTYIIKINVWDDNTDDADHLEII